MTSAMFEHKEQTPSPDESALGLALASDMSPEDRRALLSAEQKNSLTRLDALMADLLALKVK